MIASHLDLLADLLLALGRAGIKELVSDGERLRYRPRSALTPELAERLKAHKAELLAALRTHGRPSRLPMAAEPTPDFSAWQLRPDHHGRLGLEAPDVPEADRWWARGDFEALPDGGEPCPRCGSLDAWHDLVGGRRCGECDGGKLGRALQLAHRAARLRRNRPTVPRGARQPNPAAGTQGVDQ